MKWAVERKDLVEIVEACQNRNFAEEVEKIESKDPSFFTEGIQTSISTGIKGSPEDLQIRRLQFGDNQKPEIQSKGFCLLFIQALDDFILKLLIGCAIIAIIVDGILTQLVSVSEHRQLAWIQGFAILLAVFICGIVTAYNDYKKQQQFRQLNQIAQGRKNVTIIRDGKLAQLHQDKVMVGDIIMINQGMQIPADGLVIQANQIYSDQSAMTGESDPIKKCTQKECFQKKCQIEQNGMKNLGGRHQVPSPILLSGTRILGGQGKMIVIVVGDLSCVGKIQALLRSDQQTQTPLQQKLQSIANDIGKFGLISAILILFFLLLRFAIQRGIEKKWNHSQHWVQMLQYLILAITVIVVAIPEGLPLSVTISLAYSTKKMLADQNLVRKLQACQTMGGANMICSDKTGTLTLNKMTLSCWWNQDMIQIDSNQKTSFNGIMCDQFKELFVISCSINSTALLRPQKKGSSTQISMLQYIEKVGYNYENYRNKYIPEVKFPFNSRRKRMAVIISIQGKKFIFIKGASQIILNACNTWTNRQHLGKEPINQSNKNKYKESNFLLLVINSMAEKALRTIAIAYKQISDNQNLTEKDDLGVYQCQKYGLSLIALLGVRDPPRPQVPQAISLCKTAGIKVRMVTGDNIVTARAIAKDVGIIDPQKPNATVIQGEQFIKLTGGVVCEQHLVAQCDCPRDSANAKRLQKKVRVDVIKDFQKFQEIIEDLAVMARSRPQDKYALVTGLMQQNNVVAVTGDGTNDAPALKKADVGFAMGIAGTQVARNASAIILLDDNFNSIVKAVLWGRNIYDSIKKFLQFQLTINVVAVTVTLVGAITIKQAILKPIQMLWVNLIMDTFASLALATQAPTQQMLQRKPYRRDEYIISRKMFKHIILQSIYQVIVIILLTFLADQFLPQQVDDWDDKYQPRNVILNKPYFQWKYNKEYFPDKLIARSGRLRTPSSQPDYETFDNQFLEPSRHFTFLFNTFVWMQIFNFLNARKIRDQVNTPNQKNIFHNITSNYMFFVILLIIIIGQILLITFGSLAFYCYRYFGLTAYQWLMSVTIYNQVAFGSGSLLIRLIGLLINQKKFFSVSQEEEAR